MKSSNLIIRPSIVSGQMQCPVAGCEGIPHMVGTMFGPGIPPSSTSGPGLVIESYCEEGHAWHTLFTDHSGGTWISVRLLSPTPTPFIA